MAQDKMKTLHLGMPGIIALHEDSNGALSIIDGQHRGKHNNAAFSLYACDVALLT